MQLIDEALLLISQFIEPDEEIVMGLLAAAGKTLGEEDDWRRVLTSTLEPRAEDYARVFVGDAIERARAAYTQFYASEPTLEPRRGDTAIRIAVVRAGDFATDPNASEFPGGYRDIVDQLHPDPYWITWDWRPPDADFGIRYDGLVRLDDHYAWFPKPWHALER